MFVICHCYCLIFLNIEYDFFSFFFCDVILITTSGSAFCAFKVYLSAVRSGYEGEQMFRHQREVIPILGLP